MSTKGPVQRQILGYITCSARNFLLTVPGGIDPLNFLSIPESLCSAVYLDCRETWVYSFLCNFQSWAFSCEFSNLINFFQSLCFQRLPLLKTLFVENLAPPFSVLNIAIFAQLFQLLNCSVTAPFGNLFLKIFFQITVKFFQENFP